MKQTQDKLKDLELLIRSHYSIISIDSQEEERTLSLMRLLADHLRLPFFTWTRTKGLIRDDIESKGPVYNSQDISIALAHIESSKFQAIYYFQGLSDFIEDKQIAGLLRDSVMQFSKNHGAVIFTGHDVQVPNTLRSLTATFKMPQPDIEEYRDLLIHLLRDLDQKIKLEVKLSNEDLNKLLNNIKGLTLTEAEKVLTKIIIEDGKLLADDIRKVIDAKRDIIERDGVPEYYP